tara:strand:- start:1229 stop:1894 length:666 start_codon:yes stop_codon:yes gene_type:complete
MSHFSLSNKFIFIHVPKTGGVAILDYLKRTKDLRKVQDLRDKLGFSRSGWDDNHYYFDTTINTLMDVYVEGGAYAFQDFTTFGVIRDPFQRMVSMYLHRLRKPKYNTDADQKVLDRGFEYWLLNNKHRADKHITTRAQMEWFDTCINPQIICQSKLNIKWLKKVSNTETKEGSLPIKHTSNKPIDSYDQYHTTETVDFIAQVFARDIEWGNYKSPKVMYDV